MGARRHGQGGHLPPPVEMKNVVNFLRKKSAPLPEKNPGYAYEFAHP